LLADDAQNGRPLTREMYPEAWATVAEALALFGVSEHFILLAVGGEDDTYQEVTFRRDGFRLIVQVPRAVLSQLKGRELAGGIGYGLGHFLLGHHAAPDLAAVLALARAEAVADDGWVGALWDDPACADLLRCAAALAHIQDLSADRIGLLVAGDLDAAFLAAMRLFSDVVIDPQRVRETMRYAVPAAAWSEPVFRPHPSLPNRALLLHLFSASALFREASGQAGGLTVDELVRRCAPFLPTGGMAQGRGSKNCDDLLLDLILMDSLVATGRRPRPRAARMIPRYIPPGCYEQVIERYDVWSENSGHATDLLRPWLRRAARKTSLWKIAMVERFLYLVSLDFRIDDRTLGEVAALADAMGAREECRLIYATGFGYDPYCWLESEQDALSWKREARAMLLQ